jgi:hypothetical protein
MAKLPTTFIYLITLDKMRPRTPEVNQKVMQQATGSLYLITDPRADIYIKQSKEQNEQLQRTRGMV